MSSEDWDNGDDVFIKVRRTRPLSLEAKRATAD